MFFLISMQKVPSKHKGNSKDTLSPYKKKTFSFCKILMLDSLNNNTKYFLHFFLSVTLEILTEEVSFCVLLIQTQASGGEVFCSRSSFRPVAELQVGSSLPNPSPATNQSFHNLYGCSKNGLWSNTRLHTTNASCYFSTSIPSH